MGPCMRFRFRDTRQGTLACAFTGPKDGFSSSRMPRGQSGRLLKTLHRRAGRPLFWATPTLTDGRSRAYTPFLTVVATLSWCRPTVGHSVHERQRYRQAVDGLCACSSARPIARPATARVHPTALAHQVAAVPGASVTLLFSLCRGLLG